MSWMPIMGTAIAVRFDQLNEEWAQKNHSQSLTRLAERGGLSPAEALAVFERRRYKGMTEREALITLLIAIGLNIGPAHPR